MAAASAGDAGDRLLDSAPTVSSDMATPSGSHLRAATVSPAPEGNGLPAARSRHGDWTLRCSSAKKGENCESTPNAANDTARAPKRRIDRHGPSGASGGNTA